MVGYVIGLSDRHLGNILVDTETGETCHIDFGQLFDIGKRMLTPERVPFRLTANIIDVFGA